MKLTEYRSVRYNSSQVTRSTIAFRGFIRNWSYYYISNTSFIFLHLGLMIRLISVSLIARKSQRWMYLSELVSVLTYNALKWILSRGRLRVNEISSRHNVIWNSNTSIYKLIFLYYVLYSCYSTITILNTLKTLQFIFPFFIFEYHRTIS